MLNCNASSLARRCAAKDEHEGHLWAAQSECFGGKTYYCDGQVYDPLVKQIMAESKRAAERSE